MDQTTYSINLSIDHHPNLQGREARLGAFIVGVLVCWARLVHPKRHQVGWLLPSRDQYSFELSVDISMRQVLLIDCEASPVSCCHRNST